MIQLKLFISVLLAWSTYLTNMTDPIKGTYRVEYSGQFPKDSTVTLITFSDSTYQKTYRSGKNELGKIIRWYDENKKENWVRLVDNHSTPLQGALDSLVRRSFGTPVIEFLESRNDTIRFKSRYSGNLHITTGEGKLIRLKGNLQLTNSVALSSLPKRATPTAQNIIVM